MSDAHTKRIISHMNKDHQLALIDYVVVYASIKYDDLIDESVKISKIDTEQLVIEYSLKAAPNEVETFSIYWYDALEDEKVHVGELRDVKAKLISMAKYCARRQGYSHRRLTKITGPSWGGLSSCLLILFLAVNAYNPQIIRSLLGNNALLGNLLNLLPRHIGKAYQKLEAFSGRILAGLLLIHVSEILLITRNMLRRYRTPKRERLAWYAMQFFEGFFVIKRIKSLVA